MRCPRFVLAMLVASVLRPCLAKAAEPITQGNSLATSTASGGGEARAVGQTSSTPLTLGRPLSANEGYFWPDKVPLLKKDPQHAPESRWEPHSAKRPRPAVIASGEAGTAEKPATPPSDATMLFDGKSLARFMAVGKKAQTDDAAPWKVEQGYFEIVPGAGSIVSREKFGDCQLHIEWATPAAVKGSGQGRGNSGIFLGGNGELQVLDSYDNETYADGQAGALYGKYPPRVNASRRPGEWQTYDIIYEGPAFDPLAAPREGTRLTVLHNGVLIHHAVDTGNRQKDISLLLQDHGNAVRYRNIWLRPLRPYSE